MKCISGSLSIICDSSGNLSVICFKVILAAELLARKERIADIISRIDNGFPAERNLYHILCAYIFDGLMFDYLDENKLVTTSRIHNSGLDYLVILYEDSALLNEYSDMLLCSYNRLTVNGKGFVSLVTAMETAMIFTDITVREN